MRFNGKTASLSPQTFKRRVEQKDQEEGEEKEMAV